MADLGVGGGIRSRSKRRVVSLTDTPVGRAGGVFFPPASPLPCKSPTSLPRSLGDAVPASPSPPTLDDGMLPVVRRGSVEMTSMTPSPCPPASPAPSGTPRLARPPRRRGSGLSVAPNTPPLTPRDMSCSPRTPHVGLTTGKLEEFTLPLMSVDSGSVKAVLLRLRQATSMQRSPIPSCRRKSAGSPSLSPSPSPRPTPPPTPTSPKSFAATYVNEESVNSVKSQLMRNTLAFEVLQSLLDRFSIVEVRGALAKVEAGITKKRGLIGIAGASTPVALVPGNASEIILATRASLVVEDDKDLPTMSHHRRSSLCRAVSPRMPPSSSSTSTPTSSTAQTAVPMLRPVDEVPLVTPFPRRASRLKPKPRMQLPPAPAASG